MRTLKYFASLLALVLMSIGLVAQVDFVTPEEMKDLMKNNEDLVIVDANKAKTYAASHLKGAINIYHMDLYKDGDIAGLIMDPADLAAFFGERGISETTPVVIYDDGSHKYDTRTYWILKYIGAQDVKILHKDLDEWAKLRLPLTTTATKLDAVTFTPTVNPAFIADLAEVEAAVEDQNDNVVLIDARTADEYKGITSSEGHIPTAINLNFEDLLTATGAFKSAEELTKIAEDMGITPDMTIIAYCKTSVRAAVTFVAFRNILGYENVKVYDGAYNEWVANKEVVQ